MLVKRNRDELEQTDSVIRNIDFNVISVSPVERLLAPPENKQKVVHKHPCTHTNCDKKYHSRCKLQDHVNFIHLQIYNNVCDRVENGIKCEYKCEQSGHLKVHKDVKHDKIKEVHPLWKILRKHWATPRSLEQMAFASRLALPYKIQMRSVFRWFFNIWWTQ